MHLLICGATESGKTTLARILVRTWCRAGKYALIYDPYESHWYCKDVYTDIDMFIDEAKHRKNCMVVVDESGLALDRHDKEHLWLATESRHYGHSVIFVSQRPQLLSPNIRHQTQICYMFGMTPDDTYIISQDYNHPEVSTMEPLQQFQCLKIRRFKPVVRLLVDARKMTVSSLDKA